VLRSLVADCSLEPKWFSRKLAGRRYEDWEAFKQMPTTCGGRRRNSSKFRSYDEARMARMPGRVREILDVERWWILLLDICVG
jgi:hypothetical protein